MFLALGDKDVILFFASCGGIQKAQLLSECVAGYMGPFPYIDVSDELSEALLVPDGLGQRLQIGDRPVYVANPEHRDHPVDHFPLLLYRPFQGRAHQLPALELQVVEVQKERVEPPGEVLLYAVLYAGGSVRYEHEVLSPKEVVVQEKSDKDEERIVAPCLRYAVPEVAVPYAFAVSSTSINSKRFCLTADTVLLVSLAIFFLMLLFLSLPYCSTLLHINVWQ